MRTVRSLHPALPARDRLSMRLGLLFVGLFLGVAILLVAWTMFETIADRRLADVSSEVAAPVIVIDPKLQTELAKALAFDTLPATTAVHNPFLDRAGLSGVVVATATTSRPPVASGSSPQMVGSSGGGGGTSPQTMLSQNGPASIIQSYDVPSRYADWLERQKRGEFVGPESEVLAVEDLVPVGFASGGDRAQEVMLFSASLCRTFSFPSGTRFYNGSLYGFDAKEVVFAFQNGLRSKSYSDTEPCQPAAISQGTGQQ